MHEEKLLAKLDELIIAVLKLNDQIIRHNEIQLDIESKRRANPLLEHKQHPFMPDEPSIMRDK